MYNAETGKKLSWCFYEISCICFVVLSLKFYCRHKRRGLADSWRYQREYWRNRRLYRASTGGSHSYHWWRLGEFGRGRYFGSGGYFGWETGEEAGGGAVRACRRRPRQRHHQHSCSSIPPSRSAAWPDIGSGNIAAVVAQQDFGCRRWHGKEDGREDWRGWHLQRRQREYGCYNEWESFSKEVGVWCWLGASSTFTGLRVCQQVPLHVTTLMHVTFSASW